MSADFDLIWQEVTTRNHRFNKRICISRNNQPHILQTKLYNSKAIMLIIVYIEIAQEITVKYFQLKICVFLMVTKNVDVIVAMVTLCCSIEKYCGCLASILSDLVCIFSCFDFSVVVLNLLWLILSVVLSLCGCFVSLFSCFVCPSGDFGLTCFGYEGFYMSFYHHVCHYSCFLFLCSCFACLCIGFVSILDILCLLIIVW